MARVGSGSGEEGPDPQPWFKGGSLIDGLIYGLMILVFLMIMDWWLYIFLEKWLDIFLDDWLMALPMVDWLIILIAAWLNGVFDGFINKLMVSLMNWFNGLIYSLIDGLLMLDDFINGLIGCLFKLKF